MPMADHRPAPRHIPLSRAVALAWHGYRSSPLPIFRKHYFNQVGVSCSLSRCAPSSPSPAKPGTEEARVPLRSTRLKMQRTNLNEQIGTGDNCRYFAVLDGVFDWRVGLRRLARPFRTSVRPMTLRVCDRSLDNAQPLRLPTKHLESILDECSKSARPAMAAVARAPDKARQGQDDLVERPHVSNFKCKQPQVENAS